MTLLLTNSQANSFKSNCTVVVNATKSLILETLRVLGLLEKNIRIVCADVLEVSSNMFNGVSSDPAIMLVQGTDMPLLW